MRVCVYIYTNDLMYIIHTYTYILIIYIYIDISNTLSLFLRCGKACECQGHGLTFHPGFMQPAFNRQASEFHGPLRTG